MRYVALLRGINVGGNNKVPMADLKALHEDEGHTSVRTYINSGNVVFDAPKAKLGNVAAQLEARIERDLGVSPRVLVLSGLTVTKVAKALPEDWHNDDDWKTDVLYLLPERASARALKEFELRFPDQEQMKYASGAILAHTARSLGSRSALHKLTGNGLYPYVTIRNGNTARKLAAMVAE